MIAIKDMVEMPKNCNECPYSCDYCALTGEWVSDTEQIRDKNCPLVEIVTCKDCEHCRFESVEGMPYYWCDKDDRVTSEDYYCADAERRK